MLGVLGRWGWRLEMGSARHCLAAAARQLKVNMKKILIDTLYNWKPMVFRGRKGKGILSAVISYLIFRRFLLLLVYFPFLARSKKQFAFCPLP